MANRKMKAPKLPRPKVKELKGIYKDLINVNPGARLATLARGLQWFDGALPYLISKKGGLTPAQLKQHDLAIKTRKLGLGTHSEHEKEASLRKSITLYEKVCAALHPPSLEKSYEKFETKKDKLEHKQTRMSDKYGNILTTLQQWLQPQNVKGESVAVVVVEGERARGYDPVTNQFMYNRPTIKSLRILLRAKGLLAVLFQEAKYLSRPAAYEEVADAAGIKQYMPNPKTQLAVIEKMLNNIVSVAALPASPKRLVRKVYALGQADMDSTGKATRPHRSGPPRATSGPKVAGYFEAGSAVAVLYTALEDGAWHKTADLQALIPTTNAASRIRKLARKGSETGQWTIEDQADKVRLVLPKATPAGA